MYLETMREDEQQRRSVAGPIKARHRSAARSLSRRQRAEKVVLTTKFKFYQVNSLRTHKRVFAVRGALRLRRTD
jgi:hypothetical protein